MVSRTGVPFVKPAISVNANGENAWGSAEDGAQLPISVDSNPQSMSYFFLVARWQLLPKTIDAIARSGPGDLPIASLAPGGVHYRFIVDGKNGPVFGNSTDQESARCLMVVDPYSIGEHLAATAEWRFNRALKYGVPAARENDTERHDALFRLQRQVLAMEIDALGYR